jgi:hypothetical protein
MWVLLFDLLLLLLATLRVSRLVTTDNLPGQWWIYGPLFKRAYQDGPKPWAKYVEGLQCPFCVGFWIGCLGLLSLWLVGGPGDAALWWRYLAGAFALNWIVGHVAARLD